MHPRTPGAAWYRMAEEGEEEEVVVVVMKGPPGPRTMP